MASILSLRSKIDYIDNSIIKLLAQRVQLAKQVGREKRRLNLPIVDNARERQLGRKWAKRAGRARLDKSLSLNVLRSILNLCKHVQR